MSTQQTPLTYEGILKLFRRTDRKIRRMSQETDRKIQEVAQRQEELTLRQADTDRQIEKTNRQIEKTSQEIGKFDSVIGRLVENMIAGGNIVAQFQALKYDVTAHSQNKNFGAKGTSESGEIDWLLENGDIAILVEVKTTLKTDDIDEHIDKIAKYRRYIDTNGGDKKRLIGAVAGAVVADNVIKYAHKHGLHLITQSGEAFKVVATPEGFRAKEW